MSLVFTLLIAIPKAYALVISLMLMFNCTASSREEDARRKYTHRLLPFNESRL
jgi:hypothetical protein